MRTMKNLNTILRYFVITAIPILLLSACTTTSQNENIKYLDEKFFPYTEALPPGLPVYHSWDVVIEDFQLAGDFALYSYVLIKNESSIEIFGKDLITRIIASKYSILHSSETTETHELYNQFLFPQKADSPIPGLKSVESESKTVEILEKYYDYNYSNKLCHMLSKATDDKDIIKRLLKREGPFIVSILKPISPQNIKNDTHLLLLDCTDLNPEIIPLVVDKYIAFIENKELTDNEILRNLSVFLGEGILDLNKCLISFVFVLDIFNSNT